MLTYYSHIHQIVDTYNDYLSGGDTQVSHTCHPSIQEAEARRSQDEIQIILYSVTLKYLILMLTHLKT